MEDLSHVFSKCLFCTQDEAQEILDKEAPGYQIVVFDDGSAYIVDTDGEYVAVIRGTDVSIRIDLND